MRTISIAATKGGVGKSTLCVTLATHVHSLGEQVSLIDLDAGQASATNWVRMRGVTPGPALVRGSRALRTDLRRLAAKGVSYVFVDSPPTLDDAGIVEAAVEIADFILSPCRPSILDLGAAQTIADLADGTPLGFVLTDVTIAAAWKETNAGTVKALTDIGRHVFKSQLTHRHSYVANLAAGRTGPETDKTAATEVADLWKEIAKWMK